MLTTKSRANLTCIHTEQRSTKAPRREWRKEDENDSLPTKPGKNHSFLEARTSFQFESVCFPQSQPFTTDSIKVSFNSPVWVSIFSAFAPASKGAMATIFHPCPRPRSCALLRWGSFVRRHGWRFRRRQLACLPQELRSNILRKVSEMTISPGSRYERISGMIESLLSLSGPSLWGKGR